MQESTGNEKELLGHGDEISKEDKKKITHTLSMFRFVPDPKRENQSLWGNTEGHRQFIKGIG